MSEITNPKVELEVSVDTSGAKAGLQGLKDDVQSLKKEIEKPIAPPSGGDQSTLKDPIPPETPEKVKRQTGAIISQIQRLTAEIQAAGSQSKRIELLADMRGLDKNNAQFQAALAQLKAVEGGMNNLGMSAKATSAALRQVPAQFTDIVVSLQGGQNPMTVLLQQGGQLKDVFGSAGEAARVMGNYVLGLINPFTVAATAAAALGFAYYKGTEESKAFSSALINSGNAVGSSAQQLTQMAQAVSEVAGTQGQAAEILLAMAASGKIATGSMTAFTEAAILMERAGGQAATETAKAFTELAGAPLKATIKLNETLGYLTAAQYEQIKALEEQGRTTDAANAAQTAYAEAMKSRAAEMVGNLGYIESGWKKLGLVAAKAWDNMLGIGRSTSKLDALYAQRDFALAGGGSDATVALLDEEIARLEKIEGKNRALAKQEGERTRSLKASIELNQLAEQTDGNLYNQRKKVADATNLFAEATRGLTKDSKDYAKAEADYLRTVSAIVAVSEKSPTRNRGLSDAEKEAAEARKRDFEVVATRNKLVEQSAKDAAKAQAEAWKESNKAALDYAKQLDDIALAGADILAQASQYSAAVQAQVEATAFEATLIGKSNTERAIALKQYQIQVSLLEKIEKINASIASQEDKDAAISAVRVAADRAKANAAAEVVNDEFQRVSQQIEQSLTDALMRGFESGKGFAEVLRDTVVNMFSTMVLRPVIQATVQGGLNAIGLGGPAGGVSSLIGGANLYNGFSTGGAGLYNSFATSSFGSSLGLSTPYIDVLGTGEVGSVLSSSGASIGSAIPYIGAALAVGSLLSSLDDSGTIHTGGLAGYSKAGGVSVGEATKRQGLTFGLASDAYQASTEQASAQMAQAIVDLLDSTAATFGKEAGYWAATGFADDTSKDGAWGALAIKMGDTLLADWKNGADKWPGREFADGAEGARQYAAAVALDVRKVLLEQTPEWADTMLNALGDAPTIEALAATVQQINSASAALVAMGKASEAFANLTDYATGSLIKSLGGAEAAVASLSAYYATFYTDAERTAIVAADLQAEFDKLGLEMPTTVEEFRALVDASVSLGQTDVTGQLINLSGAFAEVAKASEAATDSLLKTWTDAQRKITSFANNIGNYVSGLLVSSGAQSAQSVYAQTLAMARAGNANAMQSITGAASSYLDQARARTASAVDYNRIVATTASELTALPAQIPPEQLIVNAIIESADRQISAAEADSLGLIASMQGLIATTGNPITFAQFASVADGTNAELRAIFAAVDASGDGTISAVESSKAATLMVAANTAYANEIEKQKFIALGEIWADQNPGVGQSIVNFKPADGAPFFFASGGAFDSGIVSRPTSFPMGLMGEAGPEAILPLANIGGSLGVRYAGPDFAGFGVGMQAMAQEIKNLRAEVEGLRAEARATAVNTGRSQDLLKRVTRNGLAMQTEAAI
jgi:phage-related minor tail protein